MCFSIFFFKQKTAYEIYQCDWSSDVCSSDLNPGPAFITDRDVRSSCAAPISAPNKVFTWTEDDYDQHQAAVCLDGGPRIYKTAVIGRGRLNLQRYEPGGRSHSRT